MNDVLTLGGGLEEDGQGSKLQLHMPAGSETSGEENQDLDTASEVMSNSPGSETAKSVCVSGGAFNETGAATTRIMQVRVLLCTQGVVIVVVKNCSHDCHTSSSGQGSRYYIRNLFFAFRKGWTIILDLIKEKPHFRINIAY